MTNQPANNEKITEIELVYHNPKNLSEQPKITSSSMAYKILRSAWDENKLDLQEQSKVLLLNRNNKLLGVSTISTGGVSSAYIDLKLVFGLALKAHASAIIIAHNHPSGNLNFSNEDIRFTQDIVDIGATLDLQVLDHLVVTRDGYSSMEDKGVMPASEKKSQFQVGEEDEEYTSSSGASKKPALYIFKPNSSGEKPVGAIFMHGKGNGFNIVFDDKSRFVAFPPKSKPETTLEKASGKKQEPSPPKMK